MKMLSYSTSRQIGRTILKLKKESPHLFFAGGLASTMGSTYLACKATLKLEPVLDEIKHDLEQVQSVDKDSPRFSQKEHLKDLGFVYGKSLKSLVRLYGPAALLGAAGIGMLSGSHIQLTRRNGALTATAATISKAYDEYRARVREELGEEKERDLHLGLTEEEIVVDGKKQKVKVAGTHGSSVYSRIYDETNPNWQKDPELNRIFIQIQQNYFNHVLTSRGHVFLNEVYDALGLERSRAGAVVGWLMDPNNEVGDNFIDFGILEAYNADFINGGDRSVILDFNVDGVIFDQI